MTPGTALENALRGTALAVFTVFAASLALSSARADAPACTTPNPVPLQLAQASGTSGGSAASGPAMTVDEIRDCLCMEPRLKTDRDEMTIRQNLLGERQQQLAAVDTQLKAQREKLDPNDIVGQQVLKDLIEQQLSLRDLIQSDLRPAYNQAVGAYNELVGTYNAKCAARPRYAIDVNEAEKSLNCPAP
jgi:hypothetical protein